MALQQSLQQKLLQKLSPQQIQLMKLLQVPTANLEERIKEELEENPALEMSDEGSSSAASDELGDGFESPSEDADYNDEEGEKRTTETLISVIMSRTKMKWVTIVFGMTIILKWMMAGSFPIVWSHPSTNCYPSSSVC